jgi:hypothetical protein
MARHASPSRSTARRALIAVAAAGAVVGAGATTAVADTAPRTGGVDRSAAADDVTPAVKGVTGTVGHVTGTVAGLKPNPLAGTGVDPLDNGVGTRIADFRPVDSRMLTGPVAEAPSIGSIPVVGQVLGALR